MNCPYCGTAHPEPTKNCSRCASPLPEARCQKCMISVEWGNPYCKRCQPEDPGTQESCPACTALNDPEADYCSRCGSPMAVITRVVKTREGLDKLDPWRVYGVETTLVGRDEELQLLHDTLDAVEKSGRSRLALISGGEGLGKSRLLAEFERRLESSFCNAVILRGVCREEVGGAFAVIARIFRSHFYIGEQTSPELARRSLSEAIQVLLGEKSDSITRQVGELMGLSFPDEDEESIEQSPRKLEISAFKALETVLRADARRNPLLFLLDDIHLAPDPTLRLLIHLVDSLKDAPIFFVFTQLSGARRVIPPRTAQVEFELTPLSDAEVRRHITDTLRLANEIPKVLLESVVDAALGNPLVVEEILRIFIAEGVIDTRLEPWKIDASRIDEINMPVTMEDAVEARLHGLNPVERQALEMAACVGNIFWTELLRCLDGLRRNMEGEILEPWLEPELDGRRSIDDVLESLERKDMIRRQPESRIQGRQEFAFKHRLERENLYNSLPARVKQRYHRFIAQWTEREITDISDGAAEFIARHFSQARCLRRAASHYLRAGDEARRHFANSRARKLYEEALACLSDADLDLKMRAFHDLGGLHELLGEHDVAITYFRDMARYAWLLGDHSKGGAALNKLGRAFRDLGSYDDSLRYFQKALELFRLSDDERGVASTLDDIGKIHWIRGDQDRALEFYSAALEMRRTLQDLRSIGLSLSHIGTLKLQRGELRQAMSFFKEALDLRKKSSDRAGTADSYNNLAALCVEQGKYDKALFLFDEALEIAREVGFRSLEAALLNNRGEALMLLKRRDEARVSLEESKTLAIDVGHQRVLFDTLRNLSRLAVSEADRSLALRQIAEAMEIAHQLEAKTLLAMGELTQAEIHAEYIFDARLREESFEQARNSFQRAIALLDETGNGVQLAHALSSFGNFLIESEEFESGKAHLKEAAAIFRRFKMTNFLKETEKILSRLPSSEEA